MLEQFTAQDRWGQLYGLSVLQADRAWFLEHGYLSGRQSRLLGSLQLQLCAQLKDEALSMVKTRGFL
ncbi:hypothetical protein IV102_10890 [bacterium]|nr:hypothetical protein [bacterium]